MSQDKNFLEEYVRQVLRESGWDKLDDDAKQTYFPQFMAQAEQRLGAALLPLLNEESANKFVAMTKQKKASPDEWWNFWNSNIPNFEEVMKDTLRGFAEEVRTSFQI